MSTDPARTERSDLGATGSPDGGAQQPSTEKAAAAPAPDHPSKPDSPTDITKPGWKYTARKAFREFKRDQATDLAAALTYWGLLAIAPTLLVLVSLLGLFSDGAQTVDKVLAFIGRLGLPEDTATAVRPIIASLSQNQGAGIGALIGVAIALWSASGYVAAFSRAMNRIYEIDEGRGFVKLRGQLIGVTVVIIVLAVIIVAAMVLSGPVARAVGATIGLGDTAVSVWDIAKWPVIVLLVSMMIAILYHFTPNVRQPKFRWISVGAFIAILVWALATLGLALYLSSFGGGESYQQTYGALAGVIVFLLWLWLTNNALLFGAEVDAELERARELQAGIEAEETLQLPPRGTKASEKKQRQDADDVAKGRELRLSAGRSDGPSGDH